MTQDHHHTWSSDGMTAPLYQCTTCGRVGMRCLGRWHARQGHTLGEIVPIARSNQRWAEAEEAEARFVRGQIASRSRAVKP